ncbi:Chymotrypsinogen 2 [Papilio xuthus]|uniref:Chymotrypsinogen 2 n=1 Tax=Papilio xuthus TaxID=66420 RepID=A0A194Q2L6_PAPXU|nr:Chymotrypsinogen 2 [Papilio xuthus]
MKEKKAFVKWSPSLEVTGRLSQRLQLFAFNLKLNGKGEDLFESLDTQVETRSCPGVCMHTLTALICSNVRDDADCPSGMKCCMDEPLENDTAITTRRPFTTRYTTTESEEDETTTLTPDRHKDSGNIACPDVCVVVQLAQYCQAYLSSPGLCASGRVCCVARDFYGDSPPDDLVVPNEKHQHQHHHTKKPSTALTTTPPPKKKTAVSHKERECRGECISGLFVLLCDHVDEQASCADGGTCCITDSKDTTTRRPATTPRPTTPPPLPRCPSFCLPTVMAAFCKYPSEINAHTNCRLANMFCCDNTRAAKTPRPTTPRPTTTTPPPAPPAPADPRPDCPGSCVVPLLSFTCFHNAEITDVFKCKKSGTQCCAPKSKIIEVVGTPERNDSYPLTTTTAGYKHHALTTNEIVPHVPHVPQVSHVPQHTTPIDRIAYPYEPSYGTTMMHTAEKYNKYVCGVKGTSSRAGRVMGGEDGLPGEWCWQVALINNNNQYVCGAALVGTQWVLTAAHCVTNIVRSGDDYFVRVGDNDLTRKYGSPSAQTLLVATTYIHHNHNSQTLDNDIALLKLKTKAELKDGVCLVCLPARDEEHPAGKRCTVTGYGYMGETGPIPLRIREAELPIVNDSECVRKVNAVTEKVFILPSSSFCAGGEEGNDACQGDGGGPLVCQDDGFYELVGLVSWGFGCGRQDVPGVYVKVSSFIGWINQIISVNNP